MMSPKYFGLDTLVVIQQFLRFYGDFSPDTKYSPAKYEDGELKPAENK